MGNVNYNEAVAQFLSQKENLVFALEISDAIPGIKRHLLERFWDAVKTNLQSKVDSSDDWIMESDKHIANINNNGVYLFPKDYPLFPFILGNDGGKLFIGTKNVKDCDLLKAEDFFLLQKKAGFNSSKNFGTWKFFQTLNNNFYIRLSSEFDDVVEETLSEFWSYSRDNIKDLIEANISLSR